jgi:broad specificity phosphatase PhoE
MDTLYLIRHGSTALNESQRYCGSTDCSLSPKGDAQVVLLGDRFTTIPLVRIVHSPMLRCRITAKAIATAQNLPMETIDGLQEINFGDWEGLTFDEAHEKYPEAASGLLKGNPAFTFPNGESAVNLHERVSKAFNSVLPINGPTALVAHGGTIRVLLIELGLLTFEDAFEFSVDCTGITAIKLDDGAYTLASPNDTTHLNTGAES